MFVSDLVGMLRAKEGLITELRNEALLYYSKVASKRLQRELHHTLEYLKKVNEVNGQVTMTMQYVICNL